MCSNETSGVSVILAAQLMSKQDVLISHNLHIAQIKNILFLWSEQVQLRMQQSSY